MSFDPKNHKSDLLFVPLGGAGEIGMNFNMYHLDGKWIIVDCGCGFAEDYMPGIDIIVPDISFAIKHKKDIVAMILTHAHEDHIGAVQYLWHEIGCPIYATKFTACFLKEKLSEIQYEYPNKINELEISSKFDLGPFVINMVPLCHSAPEMQALLIKTRVGNIFHTGDWKFDDAPIIGKTNNEELLKQYGNEGVIALIGDSTNIFNTEYSGSESKLRESLIEIIKSKKKMVVVATFASNVARIQALIDAARASGRKIVFAGRSFKRIIAASTKSGYLEDVSDDIIDESSIDAFPRHEIMVLATGCQGEPLAALTKMAAGTHHRLKLRPKDTVIFSSKIIPGNDKKIFRMLNNLVRLDVEVITEKNEFTHVSGHPGKKELERLYKLLRPKTLIPVHGEHVHMYEHKKFADYMGVPNTVLVENGDVVYIEKEDACLVGKVAAQELAVYGNYLLDSNSQILKQRRRIRDDGIFIVMLVLTKHGKFALDPVILSPGYLDEEEDRSLLDYIKNELLLIVSEIELGKNQTITAISSHIEKEVKSKVKSILKQEVRRIPIIQVVVRHI
jgi:ribonuclease J